MTALRTRFDELSASITVLAERADDTTDLARLLTIVREADRVRADCDRVILALSSAGEADATRACLRTARLNALAIRHIAARWRLATGIVLARGGATTVSS